MNIIGFQYTSVLWYTLIPAALLVVLYVLHRRSKRRNVSALYLWDRPESLQQTGRRVRFYFPPLTFWLELFAIAMFMAAAAMPFYAGKDVFPPLVVILDNSYSMKAVLPDGKNTPLRLGMDEVRKKAGVFPSRRTLWILAGAEARVLSDSTGRWDFRNRWSAHESSSDLAGALRLGRALAPNAELFVVTDRAPRGFLPGDDTGYYSAGAPLGNTAIVNARLSDDRILLELSNYSDARRRGRLILSPGGAVQTFTLAPFESRKLVCKVPPFSFGKEIEVRLDVPGDPLEADNVVRLVPENTSPVSWILDSSVGKETCLPVETVLRSSKRARAASSEADAELIITNHIAGGTEKHRLILHKPIPERLQLTTDPLTVNTDHPLARGLSARELQWAVSSGVDLPGEVIVRRGDDPVLTLIRRRDGGFDVHMNVSLPHSNLTTRPFWPIFFWNLTEFLQKHRSGPEQRNLRAGESLAVHLPKGAEFVTVRGPDGESLEVYPADKTAWVSGLQAGLYQLNAGSAGWTVSVTSQSPSESNLLDAGPYRKDPDQLAVFPQRLLEPLAWIALLLACAALCYHGFLVGKKRGVS